jgi:hypothetical protein
MTHVTGRRALLQSAARLSAPAAVRVTDTVHALLAR